VKEFVKLFISDPIFAATLTKASGSSVHDKLAGALVNLSHTLGKSVSLQSALIELEFDQNKETVNQIFKQNSIVSKMVGKYTRKVGDEFLKTLLGELIEEVYQSKEKLECNPSFLKVDNPEEEAKKNGELLEAWCEKFVARIFDEKMVEHVPRELRAVCYYIESSGEKLNLAPEVLYPFVSGLILMRYVCNGISGPNNIGIIKDAPNDEVRGNLTYIAKVFQKLSNLETFGEDAKHLMIMNSFLEKHREPCIHFLKSVTKDPQDKSFSDLKVPEEKEIENIPMDDVKFIWKVMKDNNKKFLKELSPENSQIVSKLLE